MRPAFLWLPALLALIFLAAFVAKFPGFVDRVYWNSDAATAATLAQAVGHGTVAVQRFGYYPFFLLAVLTRSLPFHRQLWEAGPYCVALASVALLAWVSWRIAGRWAAAMTATVGVATSPFVSYDRVTLDFHTPTFVAVVVLAAFCFWLTTERRPRQAVVVVLLVAVFAGISLTDGLFAFVGIFPLATAGVVLAALAPTRRLRRQGLLALATALLAIPFELITTRLLEAAHIVLYIGVPLHFASLDVLWHNARRLGYGIVQLANGNYFLHAPLDANSVLSCGCAVAIVLGLAAPIALLRSGRRAARLDLTVVGGFWTACVVALSVGFVLSSQADTGVANFYYFTPILYAVAATVPLALSATVRRRSVAALGIGIVALTSLVNLLGSAEGFGGTPVVASAADRIVAVARAEHALYGYGSYWDSSDLLWATRGAVNMAPVEAIDGVVSPFPAGNVSSSWFMPHRTRSFLLRDTTQEWLISSPPPTLGPPIATIAITPQLTMWVYPYDIATRFSYPATPWSPDPTLATAGGFYPAEQYDGARVVWMRQGGRLAISSDGFTALTVDATVFSNGETRTLVVRDGGSIVDRFKITASTTAFQVGPLLLPRGRSILTLTVSPGPTTIGPTDPRVASILFSTLRVEKQCATIAPASGSLEPC